jgi:hypothetical protein
VRLETNTNAFTLHKLRALRRKAKLKGGSLKTDPAITMSAPNSLPVSPASSKRSRSKDSARSAAYSSPNTRAANTPFITPAVSTHSLVIPTATGLFTNGDQSHDPTPYPAFLRPTNAGRYTRQMWSRWQSS